jgi:hypothetical protein
MTTIQKFLNRVLIAAALTGVAASAAETFTPFATVEATYTDSGIKFKGTPWGPDGYELGAGLTFGVRINTRHELSLSTGYTKWEGDHNVIPGVVDGHAEAEQIPVLLNYRYRLPVDSKGRFTVFAGPTLGFIHEKASQTNVNLGALPPNVTGTTSDTAFKFAFGGTFGFNAKLTDHWSAGISAQVLRVESSTYSEYGGAASTTYEAATRPSFALTMGYSW